MYEVGLVIEGQAKLLCPIKTGRLSASITTQAYDKGTYPKGKGAVRDDLIERPTTGDMVYVGTPVFYGPYQEYGTVRSEAQPFLRPALALAQGKELTLIERNGRIQFREYLRSVT